MPSATLDVDPDVYSAVAAAFSRANDAVCDIVAAAADAAGSGGGMAGVDSSGAAWSAVYDVAAGRALAAGAALVDRLGELAAKLATTGDNHASADSSSVPGGGPVGAASRPSAVSVVPATPPSAAGSAGGEPFGWSIVAHLLAGVWPNGHQDRLRAVASGWSSAASALDAEADALSGPIGDLSALRSPEVDAVVAACTDVQLAARSLAAAFAALAHVCDRYAAELDRAHAEIRGALSGVEIARAVADLVADALSDIASAISTVLAGLEHVVGGLVDVLRDVVASIEKVVKQLGDLAPTITAQVAGSGRPATRRDYAKLAAMLRKAAQGRGNFMIGRATRAQIDALGMAWVGAGAHLSRNGRAWISADGLRQYRPPAVKSKSGKTRANLEWRDDPNGGWPNNAHIDVVD